MDSIIFRGNAGVAQWQSATLPMLIRGSDSPHSLKNSYYVAINADVAKLVDAQS